MAEEQAVSLDVFTAEPYNIQFLTFLLTEYVVKCGIRKNVTTPTWQPLIPSLFWFYRFYW